MSPPPTQEATAPAQEAGPVTVKAEAPAPAAPGPTEQAASCQQPPAPADGAPAAVPPQAPPAPQPFTGTFAWENVEIRGAFKDGVGSITITFH